MKRKYIFNILALLKSRNFPNFNKSYFNLMKLFKGIDKINLSNTVYQINLNKHRYPNFLIEQKSHINRKPRNSKSLLDHVGTSLLPKNNFNDFPFF